MSKLVAEYLAEYLVDKKAVWSPSTYKSTVSRLKHLTDSDPLKVYKTLKAKGYKPYYIKITFICIATFMDWCLAQGRATIITNSFKQFIKTNSQLFRNVYEDKYSTITWEEFQEEYKEADNETKTVLMLLAYGGCRLAEVFTYDGKSVVGKGSKRRIVHLPSGTSLPMVGLSSDQIRARLRYNPHAYRKLAADQWFRNGLDLKTVQVLLGHTSIASTQRYLRPMEQDELQLKLEQAWRSA